MGRRSRRAHRSEVTRAARPRSLRWLVVFGPPLLVALLALGFNHAAAAASDPKLDPWSSSIWAHWDSGHYLKIAREGYELFPCNQTQFRAAWPGGMCGNTGWLPAYPWLIRLATAAGAPPEAAAHAISSIFFVGLLLVVWVGLLGAELGAAPLLCLLLAGFFPGQVYLHAVFPMSLAVLAASASLLLTARGRWLVGGLAGAVATMTYSSMVLLPALLLAGAIASRRWRNIATAPIAALGLAIVYLDHHIEVGAWNAFYLVQEKYGHGKHGFGELFFGRMSQALHGEPAPLQSLLVCVLAVAGIGALVVNALRRRRAPEPLDLYVLLYNLAMWLAPFFTTFPTHSFYRGEVLVLPVVLLLRRLPLPLLALLTAATVGMAWSIAQLFFRNILI